MSGDSWRRRKQVIYQNLRRLCCFQAQETKKRRAKWRLFLFFLILVSKLFPKIKLIKRDDSISSRLTASEIWLKIFIQKPEGENLPVFYVESFDFIDTFFIFSLFHCEECVFCNKSNVFLELTFPESFFCSYR